MSQSAWIECPRCGAECEVDLVYESGGWEGGAEPHTTWYEDGGYVVSWVQDCVMGCEWTPAELRLVDEAADRAAARAGELAA